MTVKATSRRLCCQAANHPPASKSIRLYKIIHLGLTAPYIVIGSFYITVFQKLRYHYLVLSVGTISNNMIGHCLAQRVSQSAYQFPTPQLYAKAFAASHPHSYARHGYSVSGTTSQTYGILSKYQNTALMLPLSCCSAGS